MTDAVGRGVARARFRPGCRAPDAAVRRHRSPRARPGPPSTSSAIRRRARPPRVVDRVGGDARAGPPAPARAGAARRAGPASAGPRPADPSGRPRPRSASSARSVSVIAPWRYSSANPRIVVSGVRSSWLASATNRRIRSSDRRAGSSDASVAANAVWICASIPLSAADSRPTSVLCVRTRGPDGADRPAAMAAAVVLHLAQRAQAAPHDEVRRARRGPAEPRRRSRAGAPPIGCTVSSTSVSSSPPSSCPSAMVLVTTRHRCRDHRPDPTVTGRVADRVLRQIGWLPSSFVDGLGPCRPGRLSGRRSGSVAGRVRLGAGGPGSGGSAAACAHPCAASRSCLVGAGDQRVLQRRGHRHARREQPEPRPAAAAPPTSVTRSGTLRSAPHRPPSPRFAHHVADAAQGVDQPRSRRCRPCGAGTTRTTRPRPTSPPKS